MRRFIVIFLVLFTLQSRSIAQMSPFQSISSHSMTLSEAELTGLEAQQDKGTVLDSSRALVFLTSTVRIVVRSGPSNDMLSYRIQGFRNPTLALRPGTEVHLLFANVDDDMHHDVRFGDAGNKFTSSPEKTGTVGTTRLAPSANEKFSAEDISFRAVDSGTFKYFCSVTGHAASGMWGNFVVGSNLESLSHLTRPQMPMKMHTSHGGMDSMGGMEMGASTKMEPGMKMDSGMKMNQSMNGSMHMIMLTEPMSQEGSGTSWLPASSPIYAYMYDFDDWMLMVHGFIMPRFDHQGGPRGAEKFDAPNMEMLMLHHNVGTDGRFSFLSMFSLDPLTEGKGYPLLFQTGDVWQGQPLPDYKDPHNLFAELAVTYSYRFAPSISSLLYLGYPGEPAIGPPVFMHRPSAMSNPDAPIGHDWMDGTHVTFGVATAGVSVGNWKLEGSVFNGSAPSTNLYGFDKLQINSYSGRVSFNPSNELAFQISSGYFTNPDGDSVNVIRSSASAIYTQNYGGGSWWATTLSWGENHAVNLERKEAFLLESQYTIPDYTFFGRAEYVQKSDADLALSDNNRTLLYNLSYAAIGLTRTLFHLAGMETQIGGQVSYHFVPASLQSLYSDHPISFELYLAIHPAILASE